MRGQSSAFVSRLAPLHGANRLDGQSLELSVTSSSNGIPSVNCFLSNISTLVYKSKGNGSSILPSVREISTSRHIKRSDPIHFHRSVTSTAHDFIRDEVYTIHLVGVAREIRFELVGLEIPYLRSFKPCDPPQRKTHTFKVLSLLALTNNLESALHVSLYTAPT